MSLNAGIMRDKILKIGLIGAGAIAHQAYLPLLKDVSGLKLTAVVEPDKKIRASLTGQYPLTYLGDDLNTAMEHMDAVIICVPNYLHFPICKACLEAGKHVLCEKPMTTNTHECKELISLANKYSLKLAVAHVRRFYPAAKKIKEIIVSRELGDVKSFDFVEGTVFSWPTVSGFFFDKKKAGGGVLMDIGVHLFDLLLWWLPCETVHVNYEDDNLGGVEAFAKIDIGFANSITGTIALSRLSILNNYYTINFEEGNIKWNPFNPRKIYIQKGSKRQEIIKTKRSNPVEDLLNNFVDAIQNQKSPEISGLDALKTIQFIESCYNSRRMLPLEWLRPNARLENLGKNINS